MLSKVPAEFETILPFITVDRGLAFERPPNRAALAYWHALRGGRPMPARAELKPAGMRAFLQFVNLVDIDPEDRSYMVSLQSPHTREVFGDLTKRKFRELFSPSVAERWRYCFDLVGNESGPVRLSTQVGTQGQLWLQCEVLIAPLSESETSAALASLFWIFVSWPRDGFDELEHRHLRGTTRFIGEA